MFFPNILILKLKSCFLLKYISNAALNMIVGCKLCSQPLLMIVLNSFLLLWVGH